jgi:acetyl esterase/lipase
MKIGTFTELIFLISISFASAGLWAQDDAGPVEKYSWDLGYEPDKTVEFYKPEEGTPLELDMFFPDNHTPSKKTGCIVFFFGGGWSGGDTKQFYGYGKYMASRGLVAVSAQYRTRKSHKAIPRQCVEDGKEAIRYIRRHAKEFGIDPNKIIAGGGSAGGQVAAACALCPRIDSDPGSPVPCQPSALVLFNPVYDNGPEGYGHSRVTEYWKDISPFHNIRPGLPPTIAFFGSNDKHVPVTTINAFQKQMTDAGNTCETHIYEGQSHGFFHISKGGRDMFEDVLAKADAFLVKHGFLSGDDKIAAWTANAINRLERKGKQRK